MHTVSKVKSSSKQLNKFKSNTKRNTTSLNKRKLSTKHLKSTLSPSDQLTTNSTSPIKFNTSSIHSLIQSQFRFFSTTSNDPSYNVHAHRSPFTAEEKEKLAISQKQTQEQDFKTRQSMFEHFGKPKPPNPYDIQIDPKTNMPYDPYSDPKNELYIPGPKIDDDSNPYSIATRQDNEEYVRQMTILNNFQEGMKELTGFIDPFYDQTKTKEQLPSTRGEMNSMLQHAIIQQQNYELGWERFSKMINAVPDYLKTYLSSPLFDQFNTPILFKRDADVGANEEKVIFQPDMRSYQLITVACLQAFEVFKTTYHPRMLQAAIQIARANNFTNSQNDDRLDSEATVMLNQLNEIETEIQRRLTLPIEEQERLISLENGGLGHIGSLNDVNEVSNNMGLHKAIALMKSNDLSVSNKLVYDEKLGIPEHQRQFQQREKLLAMGQTIVEIVDDPTQISTNGIKYKANRRVTADSDDDDEVDTNNNEQRTILNDENNTTSTTTPTTKSTPKFGHALLSGYKTADGFHYKISLPQLPYSLDYGEELDEWKEKLTEIATIALQTSQELQEVREIMTQDPFSEEYHCLQQVSTWNARLNFVLRDIMEHYYGLLWNRSPQLYQLLRSTTYPPPPNYSGVDALNDAIGQNTELLDTVINAAKDQKLHHLWLEAVTLKSKFTPAPTHLLTIPERQMMLRENYLKEMIFNEIIGQIPTGDYKDDLTLATTTNTTQENDQKQELIPKLTPQQFFRCLKLFLDFDQQVQSYIKAVKNYDNNFLADIDIKRKTENLINNTPQKLSPMDPEELAEYNKAQDELKKRDELHRKIQEKNGGFKDFETKSYQFKQTQLSDLTPEQINEYRLRRPQPLPEMLTMDRMIGETIRRYPLLASLAPRDCSHYIPIETIIEKRYGNQSKLPGPLKTINFTTYGGLPLNPTKINITQFGFDSIDKVLAYPYPQALQDQINTLKVTMIKVPMLNSILISPNEVEVQSSRHNYKHLLLSPSTSLMTMTDAIDFINKFTGMAKLVQTQEIELGRVEEVQEYSYQIDYQSFLQSKYQKMVQIHQIMDNSLCIRNMSRLGMYYIDTMIISWAAQQGKRLPPQYCQLVTESYTTLTNDIFQQEIGSHTPTDNNIPSDGKSQQTLESKSLEHDLSLVNPRLTRIQQWKLRNLNDELTNPTKFFALPVDARVELIDTKHQEAKETNTFAQFFLQKLDQDLPPEDPLQPYHLLRSYLRFAIRAGDTASLEKALYVYRQTTRLVEYVQRRTNEDVYVDGADSMFANVTTEEEFNKAVEQQELLKQRNEEIDAEIPAAIRNDMTRDDVQKATTNIGPKSKLYDKWYGTTNIKPPSDNKDIHDAFSHDPRGQPEAHNQVEQREMDQLVNESGMLDDYADRIDALLTAKHTHKKSTKKKSIDGNDDEEDDGDVHSVLSQELGDEKHIEMYKNMVKKQKSTKLGELFVPGFDMSEEHSSDEDELNGDQKSSDPKKKTQKMKTSITPDGRMENEIDDEEKRAEMEKKKIKHAPHTRLSKLANAPHIPFDYMLTHMVINFHQLLIRNGSHAYRIGLPNDVVSKRFSDEVSAHWALARRQLYDKRIALVHSFDSKINAETGLEYTPSEYRERQKEKTKIAVKMLKRNRNETDLNEFEKDAAQIAIMTLDTLILEKFIPVAKIIAKQAYDDGLLTKDFIETFFEKNGPDLDANPADVVSKELGIEKLMQQQ